MPHPKVKISDNSGNEVSVTENKLDVNIYAEGGSSCPSFTQFDAHASTATPLSDSTNGIGITSTTWSKIIIQCDFDNTGYIMIGGGGGGGSAQPAADTNGIRLHAGDTFILPVKDPAQVYIIGSTSSQKVNVMLIN